MKILVRGYNRYKKDMTLKLIIGSLNRGLVEPLSIGAPQRGVSKHLRLDRMTVKIVVSHVLILLRFFTSSILHL
jgi:hypothetical protein